MQYWYDAAACSTDRSVLRHLDAAAQRLFKKLKALDRDNLSLSQYNRRYLKDKIRGHVSTFQLYNYLLALCFSDLDRPLSEIVLVDYGGGSGVLSLLAKEAGIGTVIYTDIYPVSCEDVRVLSAAIGITIDYVLAGDIEELVNDVTDRKIRVDALLSYDVIEHIYDVDHFLEMVSGLPSQRLCLVCASGANGDNPRIRKALMKLHVAAEHTDRERKPGAKERDCYRAFLEVRKELITQHAPDLDSSQVAELVSWTRGLRQDDILRCVEEYQRSGGIDYRPRHPTNTCDPYTGNWCEQLLDTVRLENKLSSLGFKARVLAGYLPTHSGLMNRLIRGGRNLLISRLPPRWSRKLAPFYVLCGVR